MLTYLHGKPTAQGCIRAEVEDFFVQEQLGFEPSGAGEHVFLWIRKRSTNTNFVAEQLSKLAKVHPKDVSFAGMKDRHAVTEQWFCVRMAGKADPDWQQLNDDCIEVLRVVRHAKKLRRGTLKGNLFRIKFRNVENMAGLAARFEQLVAQGVPNYFGEQRFGHDGKNLEEALAMFAGKRIKNRNKKSLCLSAARSYLYNQIVSQRLAAHQLNPLAGDVVMLQGSNSFFHVPEWTPELLERLQSGDVGLSAPLWGRGTLPSTMQAQALEQAMAETLAPYAQGLEAAGLEQDRRRMLLHPEASSIEIDAVAQSVEVTFELPSGCFATSLLRELITYTDASQNGAVHSPECPN